VIEGTKPAAVIEVRGVSFCLNRHIASAIHAATAAAAIAAGYWTLDHIQVSRRRWCWLLGLIFGSVVGGGDGTTTTAEPVAMSTVTATATIRTTEKPQPAPTKTVKVTVLFEAGTRRMDARMAGQRAMAEIAEALRRRRWHSAD